MARRTDGPFEYYRDLYGVDAAAIRTAAQQPGDDSRTLAGVAADLGTDGKKIVSQASGGIQNPLLAGPTFLQQSTAQMSAKGTFAVGLMSRFANDVETFDDSVESINQAHATQVRSRINAQRHEPDVRDGIEEIDRTGIAASVKSALQPRYKAAVRELDRAADQVAKEFRQGPTDDNVRDLIRQGLIPLTAAWLFPTLRLSDLDRQLALAAVGLPPTDLNATPQQIRDWWKSLSPSQRRDLAEKIPGFVGNTNGIPILDRHHANRIALPGALKDLRQQLKDLGPAPPERILVGAVGMRTNPAYTRWKAEHDRINGLITGTEDISAKLDSGSEPPYFLIGFRPFEGNGQAIVSRGNPDTSDYVTTFVPGTTSKLAGIDGDINRSDLMRNEALLRTNGSVAAVTWYDYEAPQSVIPEAASRDWAKAGGPTLSAFSDGLRSTHEGPASHNTFIGHSYGGTTVGHAAIDGNELDADSIVFVATPGAGAGGMWSSGDAGDLDLGETRGSGHTYATRSDSDPIKYAESLTLGTAPVSPAFGAHVFESDNDGGHSDYWTENNPGLKSLGLIIVDRGSEVPRPAPPDDDGVEMIGP